MGIYSPITLAARRCGRFLHESYRRASLVDERDTLLRHQPGLESFNPRCVVLIGHLRHELDTKTKRQAFELFRGQQSDVEIITFDEMYERTERLIDVLEGNKDQ
jgi:hypothetical protein